MKSNHFFKFVLVLFLLCGTILPAQTASAVGAGPLFLWAKGMGAAGSDTGYDMTLDTVGNVYVTGSFNGTVDFDPGPGTTNLTSSGTDIFIVKFDLHGNFLWAKQLGGNNNEGPSAIALDGNGNVITTGYFQGTVDFDPGAGVTNLTSAGFDDIFVSKLDSNGNYLWAKGMGGGGYEWGNSITTDVNNNVYTTGGFAGTADFDPDAGTANLTSAGGDDIFVSKFDSDGNYIWAKNFGGSGDDYSWDIASDASNNLYIVGDFQSTVDFDPGPGTSNLISVGFSDMFVNKLDSDGIYQFVRQIGGSGGGAPTQIILDASNNMHIVGTFNGTVDFDPGVGTAELTSVNPNDIFVCKLDFNGNYLWARGMGGNGVDIARSTAVDGSGNVYTTGYFQSTVDFDPGPGTANMVSAGASDIFVSQLNSNGNYVWAGSMGGSTDDTGYSIALASSGNVYLTGSFSGTADFDPGLGTANLTSAGSDDIFVSKLVRMKTLSYSSSGANDGWVLESTETSGVGGTKNNRGSTLILGDDVANKQYRSVLSFTTAGIPTGATITKVTLRVKRSGVVGGGNPFRTFKGLLVDIKKGNFGTAKLALGDFKATADKTYGPFKPALSGGWYSIDLTSGQGYINRASNTQMRLRFKLDDNNNSVANYLKLYSGNAGATSRPQLIVEYYIP